MGEAHGICTEGRAVLGVNRKKIQCKYLCAILDEPPYADPHVRWCERGRLAAAPYSILAWEASVLPLNYTRVCLRIHGYENRFSPVKLF